MHFEEASAVHRTLRRITKRLEELGIPYAVAGGMALFLHGFRRFTEDVDILVTRDGLKLAHERLEGLGYVPPFAGSKNLRDAETGVKIEFLVTGDYPGDGKPKPVSFPDPSTVAIEKDGLSLLNLESLVELKLASGMTNPDRMKDLADVLELIKTRGLPRDFVDRLNPFVHGKYAELWDAAQGRKRKFITLWRTEAPVRDGHSLDQLIQAFKGAAESTEAIATLEAMREDGVELDHTSGSAENHVRLVTFDPAIAKKYGMHDESEFLNVGPASPQP